MTARIGSIRFSCWLGFCTHATLMMNIQEELLKPVEFAPTFHSTFLDSKHIEFSQSSFPHPESHVTVTQITREHNHHPWNLTFSPKDTSVHKLH